MTTRLHSGSVFFFFAESTLKLLAGEDSCTDASTDDMMSLHGKMQTKYHSELEGVRIMVLIWIWREPNHGMVKWVHQSTLTFMPPLNVSVWLLIRLSQCLVLVENPTQIFLSMFGGWFETLALEQLVRVTKVAFKICLNLSFFYKNHFVKWSVKTKMWLNSTECECKYCVM